MIVFSRFNTLLKFLLPAGLWCILYRDFLFGDLRISEDTFAVFAVVKYFLANLMTGTFPHWNPFMHWGMAHVCQIGEFNPIWLLILLLNSVGLDVYHGFLWTCVAYFFLAAVGFYCVLRRLFTEEILAYLGFVIFVFSGIGMTLFTQVTMILIFAPAVWFFYFLIDFYQRRTSASACGIGLTLMLILTTYIPFYFLTTLLCLAFLITVFYFKVIKNIFIYTFGFIKQKSKIFILILIGIGVACLASVFNWLFLKGDFLVLARPAVINYAFAKDSGISIAEVLRDTSLFSGFIEALRIKYLVYYRELFTLHNLGFNNQRILYIPLIAHLILCAGIMTALIKRTVFWLIAIFILFFIAIAGLTPFYEQLFTWVYFFKMFRNVFLLIPFIISLYIILAIEQMRLLWFESRAKSFGQMFWAVLSLALFYIFFYPSIDRGIALVTGIGFGIILLLRLSGVIRLTNRFALMAIVVLVVLNPIFVLSIHANQFKDMEGVAIINEAIKAPLKKPEFVYVRPESGINYSSLDANDVYRWYNWHFITMTDAAKFFTFNYGYPTRWSYALAKNTSELKNIEFFDEYVRHKFIIYDFFETENFFNPPESYGGIYVNGASPELSVTKFTANEVELNVNLHALKFLVYNDSYHPGWRVYIDGKRALLNRANHAFKGVWVAKGEHQVRFVFEPIGTRWAYVGFIMFFYAYFVLTIWLIYQQRERV